MWCLQVLITKQSEVQGPGPVYQPVLEAGNHLVAFSSPVKNGPRPILTAWSITATRSNEQGVLPHSELLVVASLASEDAVSSC